MAAYLIVDLDRLLKQFKDRSFNVDLQEMAVAMRGRAALAAGVPSEQLRAIAAADWDEHRRRDDTLLEQVFRNARFELFDVPAHDQLVDALQMHYFAFDSEPVTELILVTVGNELMQLSRRVKMTRSARTRLWGLDNVLTEDDLDDGAIFQDLGELLGIESRNVALYIDFENIAISLSQQSFLVNLDRLIAAFVRQARAHGNVTKMAAYAPWGNRGALPPLIDTAGNDVTAEAQSRLAFANIDPVYHLPGKNSADVKIANDVLTHSTSSGAADVYILATGDRDFNEVVNTLASRGKSVIIWGVHGALSRQLSANPNLLVEYIDEFTNLETYASRAVAAAAPEEPVETFAPSQWSSLIVQFDRLTAGTTARTVKDRALLDQLLATNAVLTDQRGEDLIAQAISLGILRQVDTSGTLALNDSHPIVDKTRLIRDRVTLRVANTLQTRSWNYVNYGFLLKGLAMDRELERPGLNRDDQWRSHWIDFLVREGLLVRELTPHHLNPEDLVPVIRMPTPAARASTDSLAVPPRPLDADAQEGDSTLRATPVPLELNLRELTAESPGTASMLRRIIVSVEQFTSYRRFEWCPLGSLHQRLRPYDIGMTFQSAVEYLIYHEAVAVAEYPNPQSLYNTKGISLILDSELVTTVLTERDAFIRLLLALYRRDVLISVAAAREAAPMWDHDLWFSIMERENVLNALNGRPGFYSLFRTHHTVAQVASQMGDTSDSNAQDGGSQADSARKREFSTRIVRNRREWIYSR
ncbi:MAG: NYN domain protein [Chloroflexi bacterium OLB13]|nr:MAG: NYN domain protein [Chloroflexi bacterium OLB13]